MKYQAYGLEYAIGNLGRHLTVEEVVIVDEVACGQLFDIWREAGTNFPDVARAAEALSDLDWEHIREN